MATVAALEPGEVRLSLESRTRHSTSSSSFDRLSVATPVYSDGSSECFGMTVIKTDISKRIKAVLLGLGAVDCKIFVADGLGHLWVSADSGRGVQLANRGQMIPDLPTPVVEQMSKKGEPFELRRKDHYIAQRFYVDPTGRGVTIFATLPKDD